MAEFDQLGLAALSGHGEVLGPISGLSTKMKKSVKRVWRSSGW